MSLVSTVLSGLVRGASSTSFGSDSEAGARVIHVATQGRSLLLAVNAFGNGKYARVRFALSEPEIKQPREECSLPPLARLRHAVNGLLNTADAGPSVSAEGRIARRSVAVHHLVLFQIPLQVGGDKVPSTHSHASAISDRSERTGMWDAWWRRMSDRSPRRGPGHTLARTSAL
eukprot:4011093-Pleurochrysis_carterae.AAC.4